jgi:Trk K+ transport system NAD-binding subunit
VVESTVPEDVPIAGQTLEAADENGLLADEHLVASLERGDEMLTPKEDTTVKAGDVLTLLAPGVIPDRTARAFRTDSDQIPE